MPTDKHLVSEILSFWFESDNPEDFPEERKFWWKPGEDADDEIRAQFAELHGQAVSGKLDSFRDTALGTLALVILLDQFSRNIFRGTPAAFACDTQARELARYALEQGFDEQLPLAGKLFLYMPFEHSEDLGDQDKAVELIGALGNDEYAKYAIAHRDVIERYGRFPHRNEILGRENTPEEVGYLKENEGF